MEEVVGPLRSRFEDRGEEACGEYLTRHPQHGLLELRCGGLHERFIGLALTRFGGREQPIDETTQGRDAQQKSRREARRP
jgi:hypothetical protein